jgi:hypothetical protein
VKAHRSVERAPRWTKRKELLEKQEEKGSIKSNYHPWVLLYTSAQTRIDVVIGVKVVHPTKLSSVSNASA